MIVLGVDASLGSTGLSVLDTKTGDVKYLGKIVTSIKKATPTESARLEQVFNEFRMVLHFHKPDVVVMENQHIRTGPMGNAKTGMSLSRVRGVIQLATSMTGIPFYTFEPSQIKQCVTGKGNAKKEAVQEAVVKLYANQPLVASQLQEIILKGKDKTDDIADALAIAHTFYVLPDVAVSA